LIQLETKGDKAEEQIRSMDDYILKFDKLLEAAKTDKVKEINFYTEIDSIKSAFKENNKFKEMSL
jgi:uncharacterized protein with von Willebrand factor type A (vWA) domain